MKVYTKTGDKGMTSLVSGVKVAKSDLRLDAYGTVDELNAHIGLLHDLIRDRDQLEVLNEIRNLLFVIGANLADDGQGRKKVPVVKGADISLLEQQMDNMTELLEPLKYFILPGGHPTVSTSHVARTVCRRAERMVVKLSEHVDVDHLVMIYLNRLSDYLFVLGRKIAKDEGVKEVFWKPKIDA